MLVLRTGWREMGDDTGGGLGWIEMDWDGLGWIEMILERIH